MALRKGPFDIEWGANTLADVEEIDVEYDVDSEEYETVQGRRYTVSGGHLATVTLTLLSTDIASLAAVLPQYHVAMGSNLSTGEYVIASEGAIDIVPGGCEAVPTYNDLDVVTCGNPGQVFRLVNARTEIDGIEFDSNKIQRITVRFIGEPAAGQASAQFFQDGASGIS